MHYSVGDLSRLAGVSIRTLHHYDQLGLLTPSQRTLAGYRQYAAADVERLHRILVYRELGFDLAGIAAILDDTAVDAMEHLRRQHSLLLEQMGRLHRMVEGLEAMMSARRNGFNMTEAEMQEVFGAFDPAEHEAEAEQRWGDTDAFRESQERTRGYGVEEWKRIKAEAAAIETGLVELMQQGVAAESEQAMDLAEQHRQHISRWFYECSYEIHCSLGEMYTADPRFAAHYDAQAPGLAAYVRDAVLANSVRAAG